MIEDQSQNIKVLVADRSSYARLVLENILTEDEDIQLLGLAADGDELISLLKQTNPEVVLLNNSLPKNNRFFTLKRISSELPTPVVLMITREELTLNFVQEALKAGVYAIVIRPVGKQLPDYRSISANILEKIKAVRHIKFWDEQQRMQLVQRDVALVPDKLPETEDAVDTIIVIGASTGGTQAIEKIVKELAPDTGASFLVAVHLPAGFTTAYTKRLQVLTPLPVKEGRQGMALRSNKIIVAPGGRNMIVQQMFGSGLWNGEISYSKRYYKRSAALI